MGLLQEKPFQGKPCKKGPQKGLRNRGAMSRDRSPPARERQIGAGRRRGWAETRATLTIDAVMPAVPAGATLPTMPAVPATAASPARRESGSVVGPKPSGADATATAGCRHRLRGMHAIPKPRMDSGFSCRSPLRRAATSGVGCSFPGRSLRRLDRRRQPLRLARQPSTRPRLRRSGNADQPCCCPRA